MNLRNRVQLIGNMGKNPIVKDLDNGTKMVRFSLATNEFFTQNGEKKQETTWHNVVAWNKTAEIIEKYMETGAEVVLNGKLRSRSYDDEKGEKKYTTEVIVGEILFRSKD